MAKEPEETDWQDRTFSTAELLAKAAEVDWEEVAEFLLLENFAEDTAIVVHNLPQILALIAEKTK